MSLTPRAAASSGRMGIIGERDMMPVNADDVAGPGRLRSRAKVSWSRGIRGTTTDTASMVTRAAVTDGGLAGGAVNLTTDFGGSQITAEIGAAAVVTTGLRTGIGGGREEAASLGVSGRFVAPEELTLTDMSLVGVLGLLPSRIISRRI